MPSRIAHLSALLALLALPLFGQGAIWYVDSGAAAGGSGTATSPFMQIQTAVNTAGSGDEIRVAPGQYQPFTIINQSLRVVGVGGADVTLVSGAGLPGPVMSIIGAATDVVIIEGLSLTGGLGFPAGGVSIGGATTELTGCNVVGNSGDTVFGGTGNTGGIAINTAAVTLTRCQVSGNQGSSGTSFGGSIPGEAGGAGGLRIVGVGSLIINQCQIEGNTGGSGSLGGIICGGPGGCSLLPGGVGGAGGIDASGLTGPMRVARSQIRGNVGGLGAPPTTIDGVGGLFVSDGATIENSEIVQNSNANPAVAGVGGVSARVLNFVAGVGISMNHCTVADNTGTGLSITTNQANTVAVDHSIVWGNGVGLVAFGIAAPNVNSCDIQGGVLGGVGNINADPLFQAPQGGDYHLQSGSPCIDSVLAGGPPSPPTDLDGDPRLVGLSADMGSDEATLFLSLQQAGPGAPITLSHDHLQAGAEIYTVFTLDLCAPMSSPTFFGLCLSSPASVQVIASQLALPLGTPPFHFIAPSATATFGPFLAAPMTLEALTADASNGVISRPVRLTVQ